jgi:AcrR family transcriptional regulator
MADLLWGTRKRVTKGPKPNLDLDRIVAEAVRIADTKGLGALSMNSLASALGVGTMSLYRYVPGKDELVALMLDTAIGDPPPWPAGQTWRQSMHRWAALTLEIFDRHPWTLPVVASPRRMGPCELAWAEIAMQAASDAGARPDELASIVMLVNSYVRGAAQLSAKPGQGPGLDFEAITRSGTLDRYPMLKVAIGVSQGGTEYDGRQQERFEFGLERVLDGIELYLNGRK